MRRRTIDNAVCLCTSWRCLCTPTICSMGACSWSARALRTTHLVQSSSYLLRMAGINLKHDSLPQERAQPGQSPRVQPNLLYSSSFSSPHSTQHAADTTRGARQDLSGSASVHQAAQQVSLRRLHGAPVRSGKLDISAPPSPISPMDLPRISASAPSTPTVHYPLRGVTDAWVVELGDPPAAHRPHETPGNVRTARR